MPARGIPVGNEINKEPSDDIFRYVFWIIGLIIVVAVIFVANPIVSVPAGSRGILLRWGAAITTLNEGLNFKAPLIDDVKLMSVQTQVTQTDASAASKNLQDVTATIAVNYHVSPDGALWLYKNIGTDFKGRIIDPAIQESVKAVTAQYLTEDLIGKRADVRTGIENILKEKMDAITKGYIIIDAVNIVNFKFSGEYTAAIEAKATAEQKLGEQQRQLEIIKVQAEQAIAEATGKAEARVKEAEAEAKAVQLINEQLKQSPAYVQLKYAEKWDGKLPVYVMGGGIPFIQVPAGTTITGG